MQTYHAKLTYGIQKYFPGFQGRSEWNGDVPITDSAWQKAVILNHGKPLQKEQYTPLCSVFQFLKTGNIEDSKVFPYKPLSIQTEGFFPSDEPSGDFQALYDAFSKEWESLRSASVEKTGETLLFLAKKYLSKVGCSPEMSHISAFEHIKTTAALMECVERGEDGGLLLVGVGLDNIQGFCYDIVSSKAAKSLKGRSFYLQMLMDTIAQDIIHHPAIKAEQGHIVYARGGKMYLILPDTKVIREALQDIRKQMIASFWAKFKSSLYCYLQWIPFAASETDLPMVWKHLKSRTRKDRSRKYEDLLLEDFASFFEPIAEGFEAQDPASQGKAGIGKKQFCRVTGELIEAATLESNNIGSDSDESPTWVLDYVRFQSDLGQGLPKSKTYSILESWQKVGIGLNELYYTGSSKFAALPDEGWRKDFEVLLKSDFKPQHQRSLNYTDFLPNSPNGVSYGFIFYGGKDQPLNPDRTVKTFEELAGRAEKGEKFTRLGVARIDLDDLSQFAEKSETSFALNATFSAQLDLFLSGYVNTIRSSRKEYDDFLNIVFSGGDDMLIVGRWDLVLDFVAEFRSTFLNFMGERDDLSFSAGMVMVTPKFPIAKAVEWAGKAEKRAKAFNAIEPKTAEKPLPNLPLKNAFCLLGEAVSWEEEDGFVDYFAQKLEHWSNKTNRETTGVSASLLNRLIQFHQMQKDEKPNWLWLSAWYFQQIEQNNDKSKAIFTLIKRFLFTGLWEAKDGGVIRRFKVYPDRTLMLMAMAARLADFRERSKTSNNEYGNPS